MPVRNLTASAPCRPREVTVPKTLSFPPLTPEQSAFIAGLRHTPEELADAKAIVLPDMCALVHNQQSLLQDEQDRLRKLLPAAVKEGDAPGMATTCFNESLERALVIEDGMTRLERSIRIIADL